MWIHICMSMPVCMQTQFFFSPFVLSTYSQYQKWRWGSLFESSSHIREHLQLVFIPKCCYVYNLQMFFYCFKNCIMISDLSINSFKVSFISLIYIISWNHIIFPYNHYIDESLTAPLIENKVRRCRRKWFSHRFNNHHSEAVVRKS